MRIDIAVDLAGTLIEGDAVFLMLEAAAAPGQMVRERVLHVPGATLTGAGQGVWAADMGAAFAVHYRTSVDVTRAPAMLDAPGDTPRQALPAHVLPFLRPSRYCPSDLFTDFATRQFGGLSGGAKAAAIRDWVASEIAYVAGASNGATTAADTFASRQGVCRDFAHVLCTLARASGLPARYASVYAPRVRPQDFHAVAQLWLGDGWQMLDATGMACASDAVLIATGRDAADVSFMETAHWADLHEQRVSVTAR